MLKLYELCVTLTFFGSSRLLVTMADSVFSQWLVLPVQNSGTFNWIIIIAEIKGEELRGRFSVSKL